MPYGPPGARPPRVDNFHANFAGDRLPNRYATGEAIVFTWNYRVRDGQGRIPKEIFSDAPIATGKPTRIGSFEVQIINASSGAVVRTIPVNDDTETTTYANATLVSDFGGSEPASLKARITNVNGTWRGVATTITILKV
jgi:hypothetical protein